MNWELIKKALEEKVLPISVFETFIAITFPGFFGRRVSRAERVVTLFFDGKAVCDNKEYIQPQIVLNAVCNLKPKVTKTVNIVALEKYIARLKESCDCDYPCSCDYYYGRDIAIELQKFIEG